MYDAKGCSEILMTSFSEKITRIYDQNFPLKPLCLDECIEITIVTDGSGIHRIMDEVTDCETGDMYILKSGIPHEYFAKNEAEGLTVHTLRFVVNDFFEGTRANESSNDFCFGVFKNNPDVSYAMLTSHTMNLIENMFSAISQELQKKDSEWREAIKNYLSLLFIIASRYINVADIVKSENTKERMIVSDVMQEVSERYGDVDMTLESLASSHYISQSHLSRLFKRETGKYFQDYVKEVRINRACELLCETNLSNSQIAEQCGLKDIPSFYRVFKAVVGQTPYQYRMLNQIKYITEKGEKTMIIREIAENLQNGKAKIVKELVQKAIDEGESVSRILNDGLLAGMGVIGEKFKANEIYVPEVLIAARALNMGMEVLKPLMVDDGFEAKGKVCIGTVQGDLHDIGKNLVKLMMEGKGLEVVDLGVDVAPEKFINAVIEQNCSIICCSSLLTTTMNAMEAVVKAAEAAGIRDKVKIMVGGAPVSEEFCRKIGADCYTSDAASAADAAAEFCSNLG